MTNKQFTSKRRVDFPMVDLAGIVYYPQYWDIAHRFFEELWEDIFGLHYAEILSNYRIGFPVVHCDTSFISPFKYGDNIICNISIQKIGQSSIQWKYEYRNDDNIVCWTSNQVTVCVDMNNITQKVPIPDWISQKFSQYLIE